MILTVTEVDDFDQFLQVFATMGVEKRRQHGCRGAWVFRDPAGPNRVWSVFDWTAADYDRFLTDPDVPAIAAQLGVQAPPATVQSLAEFPA